MIVNENIGIVSSILELLVQSKYPIINSKLLSNAGYFGCITCSILLVFTRLEKYDKTSILNSLDFRSRLKIPLKEGLIALWFIFLNIAVMNIITSIVYVTQFILWSSQFKKQEQPLEIQKKVDERYNGWFDLPLMDGIHRIQNVCLYAFFIGIGGGLGLSTTCSQTWRPLGSFIAFVSLFHTLEYCITARYQQDAGLNSFLLNHSTEYHVAMVIAVVENIVGMLLIPRCFCQLRNCIR